MLKPKLPNFCFSVCILCHIQETIAEFKQLSPCISSEGITVVSFMFKPLIHFEITFVYGFRQMSEFILLCVGANFSQD